MAHGNGDVEVEGPEVDERTQAHRYIAHGEGRDIAFTVIREERDGEEGWGLEIEQLPSPPIVHEQPWHTVQDACEAAVSVIGDIFILEHMQHEDMKQSSPMEPDDESEGTGKTA